MKPSIVRAAAACGLTMALAAAHANEVKFNDFSNTTRPDADRQRGALPPP